MTLLDVVTFLASCVMVLHFSGAQTSTSETLGAGEVVYQWVTVDYDFSSDKVRDEYIQNGTFDPTRNLISGIKTYRGNVYVTVPRLRYTRGVPSSLNQVVVKNGKPVLRPFPNWEAQELGKCEALQCAMSIEVDPVNGLLYVIDPGRSGLFGDNAGQPEPTYCPPKLVVYDLKDGRLVRSHDFPEDKVNKKTNFLNDIVLDRGSTTSTTARWVYITDAADNKLIIFDLDTNETRTVYDRSMDADPGDGSNITVNGKSYILRTPIDGLAMSPDFEYIYYCALGSKDLYQVPTRALRNKNENFTASVRFVGAKISQTGGMTYASDNLYYGALTRNAVYRWEVTHDEQDQGVNEAKVLAKTEKEIVKDDEKLQWPDSFTVDEDGYLWFTACRAHLFLLGGMDFTGGQGANFRIWRVKISEKSYLYMPTSGCVKYDSSLLVAFIIGLLFAMRLNDQ